ncbi:MAG: type IV secretion system protein [Candidatus Omnitrophica bacterium]|nr:type IV secretion system protein [Candidatus Omnitrophota bacterium]
MDLVISVIKVDLGNCLNAGRYMLVSLFILAVFIRYVGLLSHHVNWADVILRLVIGFILLQNYVWIMDTTRNMVCGVDQMITPEQDFVNQYANMSQTMQTKNENTTNQSILTQVANAVVNFGRYTIRNLIINLSFIFYALFAKVMEAIRYSMVAILYKTGPVLIPLLLFESTANVVKGWYTSYVSVLCWPILWHIILSIAVSLGNQIMTNGGLEQFACLNFAVCFVLIFSPFIINSFVAGLGVGSSSGLAGMMSSTATGNLMTSTGHAGLKTTAFIIADKFLKTPTTSSGKFKDYMLGDNKEKEGA